MKQHINTDQLMELSEDAYNRLIRWYMSTGKDKQDILSTSERMNIGNMIEYLEYRNIRWYNKVFSVNTQEEIYKDFYGEFCDALWKIVKQDLEMT